jgi:hypothetical protein
MRTRQADTARWVLGSVKGLAKRVAESSRQDRAAATDAGLSFKIGQELSWCAALTPARVVVQTASIQLATSLEQPLKIDGQSYNDER